MDYTISKLLKDNILGDYEYLTKEAVKKETVIDSCFVHELPMKDFLRRGELVLTTAIGEEKDRDVCLRTVEEAYAAGAAGIIFSFPQEEQKVPVNAIKRGRQYEMPLFQISWKLNFTAVVEEITHAIWTTRMADYNGLQSRMFNAYFEGKDMNEALRLVAETTAAEVAAVDRFGHLLHATKGFREKTHTYILGINKEQVGELWIQASTDIPAEMESIVDQYISYPLTLWFNQRRVEAVTKLRMGSDFTMRLCREDMNDDLMKEAGYLGMPLSRSYVAMVLESVEPTKGSHKAIVEHIGDIIEEAMELGKKEKRTVLAGEERGRFIAFVETGIEKKSLTAEEAVDRFLQLWLQEIKKIIPRRHWHIGISTPFSGGEGFRNAYEEALLAAAYCTSKKDEQIRFEEARTLRIMSAVAGQEQIKGDARALLEKLLAYDKGGGSMELMKTLSTYFDSNCNTSRTARALNIHRQSLLSRLQKIEEMTGMSLKDNDDRFVLEVYCRLFLHY